MLAGYRITFKIEEADLQKIREASDRLAKGIRGKIVRKGLREWGEDTKRIVRGMARRKDVRTRRSIAVKTKTYKRGKVIWCGVGVRNGGVYDVGWKSHFHDQGYRAWVKGIKADGSKKKPVRFWNRNPKSRLVPFSYRKGWRKGLFRRNLGPIIYRTEYLTRPAQMNSAKVRQYIEDAVALALREESRRGNKTP